eukprot:365889-Chlamydomonas_euryale.AAC.18
MAAAALTTPVGMGMPLPCAAPGSISSVSFARTTRRGGRGRPRGAAADGVLTVQTDDGNTYVVNSESGLDTVPEPYRAEVQQKLKVQQQFLAVLLANA